MARLYGPGPEPPPSLVSTSDLAGLSTRDVEGSPVGELVGALSEERTGMIRYLDVSLRGANKHVLVPIGHARIDGEAVPPRVRLRAATHEDLLAVPEYVAGETPMDAGYQDEVMRIHGLLFYGSRYYAHPAYDHASLHAGENPVVATAEPAEGEGLRPLSELEGYRLARDAPALLGWPVLDRAGDTVGTIEELLVEVEARRVRYMVVELDTPRRPTILPIGYLNVDRDGERVTVPTMTVEDVRLLPPFESPLTRKEENRLHAAIEGRLSGDRYFERADFRPVATDGAD